MSEKGKAQKCDICKKSGHGANECFKAAENRHCYNCKEKGHLAKDCPKPKKNQDQLVQMAQAGQNEKVTMDEMIAHLMSTPEGKEKLMKNRIKLMKNSYEMAESWVAEVGEKEADKVASEEAEDDYDHGQQFWEEAKVETSLDDVDDTPDIEEEAKFKNSFDDIDDTPEVEEDDNKVAAEEAEVGYDNGQQFWEEAHLEKYFDEIDDTSDVEEK